MKTRWEPDVDCDSIFFKTMTILSQTHEADGTKTRDAAETSSEATHVPDPLHLIVEGGIQAEMISPGQFSRPRKSKSARIDDTTPMAMAVTDVVLSADVSITQAGLE